MDEIPVSNIAFLNQLEENGILKQLISRGILPLKVNLYMEISFQVNAEMKFNGNKKRKAVNEVATRMNVDTRTVYRAIRAMNKY